MSGASSSQQGNQTYAGDIGPQEAWDRLSQDKAAQLIDVRTQAEWNFVGIPDLSSLSRAALLIEWQHFPPGTNPDFTSEAVAALEQAGYSKGTSIFFLCRSGARSRAAAIALTAAGFGPCFNVRDGFEGGLDGDGHRGQTGGWKALGLPWVQS
ncbi:MAG: hypothetical protein RJB62_1515 [Pseudomonadota bacterium]|jgi:rhodanese-related sulfurtransferase